jgi:type II secretory ATPase GspE/PulE/Tfp pilus assembly ATPase PilB-like protein
MVGFHALAAVTAGGYISTLKVIPVLLILLVWARLMTWVDKDAPAAHLPRIPLNLSFLGGMIVGFGLFFYLPGFVLSLAALIAVMGIEIGIYLQMRRKVVGLNDLQKQFKKWLRSFRKVPEVVAEAGKVQIVKDGKGLVPPNSDSPDRPAYDATQLALTEPFLKSAEQLDLAPEEGGVAVKFVVDGFTYRGAVLDRAAGADAIAYLKWAAGLNIEDRRKPQSGMIKANFEGKKREMKISTAGTTAGEYARIVVDPKKRLDYTVDTLGFTEAQKKLLKESIAENSGVVLLSTPKGQGLTSLGYAILKAHDSVLQFIQTVERYQEEDIDGITQNKLPPNAPGAEEAKLVSWVISQEPDVMLVDKVEDPKSAADILDAAKSGKRLYVCMRAGSTFEALDQWRRLVGDNHLATESLKMVISGRILRKLCMACKVGYAPDAGTLRKLNMSTEKVSQLFQARTQPLRDPKGRPIPCEFCNDLHFKGRTGVFEFLVVDNDIREAVTAAKPLNQPFRKQRGRYLQEEALTLVEKGETSVQEVLRVLKGGGEGPEVPAGKAAPRRPAPVSAT